MNDALIPCGKTEGKAAEAFLIFLLETESVSLQIVNKCNYTIWPGILSTGRVNLSTTGFTLESGASLNLSVPNSWTGRVWARTLCNEYSSGNFSCFTADCGTGKIECDGNFGSLPATAAEFGLNRTGGVDYYDGSLITGFNLPIVVDPRGAGSNNCSSSGCSADLNGDCPKELRVAREGSQGTVACMTPCMAFNNSRFCCTYRASDTCDGTVYSDYFKQRCPQAYTYSYDDNQSTYTCASANDYSIVFCPISLDQTPSKSKNHKIVIAFIAASAQIIIYITMFAGLWSITSKRRQDIKNSSLELEDGRRFMYSELVKITNNFASPIGAGVFGKVYHGLLENDIQVAVKLLISASGSSEFQNEVKLLMRAHHRNVVSFIGYSYDGKTMALVFEYVANGNLRQHLTFSDAATGNILTWKERLQIAVDAALGLDYLHNDCKPPIIHRDIKTSNILLTEKTQAKICDFGVSKLLSTETATHTMTDHVRGTRGYFDPEYYTTGKLNKKSDIYSFGVVLLELITGRTAIITDVEPEPVHICQWVRPMFQRRDIESILDSRIQAGTYTISSAWKAVEIAMECVSSTATERPDITVVYKELKECLEIEVPPEIPKDPEVDESDDCSTSSSVPVLMTSHTRSESFLVDMKSHIESETERHTNRVDIFRDCEQLQLHNLARTSLHRLITKPVTTGFTLRSGASFNLSVPKSWTGQVWGRTLCNESSTGNFSCFTADCGTGKVECDGNGAIPPATFAEFEFNNFGSGVDYYDVSLVTGFNLPMVVEPRGAGSNHCISSGCSADLNGDCPKELRVAREGSQGTVACMTPCTAFNNSRFCCTGEYSIPASCSGTAYTYAFDLTPYANQTTFTYSCATANYSIVFCPISLPAETPAKEPTVSEQVPSKSKNHTIMIASIASSAGIIIFILAVVAGLWSSRRKRQQEIQNSSLELEDGRRFMYSELVKITNNFASPIGAGGFGKVYHGILENDIQVAVKLLISASGSSEFQNDVKLLMRAHRRNVVSFTGYCYDGKTMALVFEYVANGNLQQHLTASDVDTGNILTWKERLQIAVDAAQGLDYLHNGCKPPIIHRDIKTSNILLTEKMQAKICDFGVSKLLSTETATHTMTDHVRGTRGYFDPEYYTTGKLNKKSDIYSFGIVLLELITGRTAIIEDVEPEPVHICRWVRPMFQRRDIESILDSRIQAGQGLTTLPLLGRR
ncbi:hypothetical protein ACLB2K_076098 [Fragaria x ananassa]